MKSAIKVKVRGLVQGVGFRPFIYRIAHEHKIRGWVENRNDGVIIHAESQKIFLDKFVKSITEKAPLASNIFDIEVIPAVMENFEDFQIIKSESTSDKITDISPDISVCDACLEDMKNQAHRIDYPFINCTNCGPRFSIIKDLPYDRDKTTMDPFKLCETCSSEYKDVLDRRFHAQPVACKNCGPQYELVIGEQRITEFGEILNRSSDLIKDGKIIAIKGVGGFQIACDATNEIAVKNLRTKKLREGKPFAVMFRDVDVLQEYTTLFPQEKKSLETWRRPIVIVQDKGKLAPSVSVGFKTVGAMLPYMPFHFQLFEKLDISAIVLTSGNISDEPIVIDNHKAESILTKIADAILIYNREIHNRTDDSVAISINETERIIRRSRGYSPEPINLKLNVDGIVATGAELVNCFAIGKGKQAILSQHIGDLKNLETLEFYEESYHRFISIFRVKPELMVHDLHPDYLSTRFANDLQFPAIAVQHHHAHIASCMAEHNLDEKVIGISMDGTGLGTDGNIWGGEFLIADLNDFTRFSHFEYLPLPGGDRVTKEPWRTGISLLYKVFDSEFLSLPIPFINEMDKEKANWIVQAIEKKINSPLSSSAGRLFDAVSAILNICTKTKFHAEAPMRLESIAHPGFEAAYPFDFGEVISFKPTIESIVTDIMDKEDPGLISAKFHNTFINTIFAVANQARKETTLNKVVLSGGTFQNKYISSRVERKLMRDGFEVFYQRKLPANDGGIALGQLVIGAKRRELGLL
ncbi:MAG: carbamoyltransferase HypF [Bacteroidales bacterium]|nr:carbamoyltransferase HypF [Bacteroidales bacterium]MCF8402752.1 carbamoyltransferase HypF [Bacteroidales bacterium]